MTRQVLAAFDDDGIFVYQAFKPEIVEAALRRGTFAEGFNLDRMTWIKPSFGWMLYRSGYATKEHQEGILKIKLRHEGFRTILRRGVPSTHDARRYPTQEAWRSALEHSEVRFQWDPDRDLALHQLERRAIQLGISGQTVRQYVHEWIIGLEDVTPLARAVQSAVDRREALPPVPEERVYQVDPEVMAQPGISP
jgi:hypothetical protein